MSKKAIILTPSLGFGEMVRQLLADSGALQPELLSSPAAALKAAAHGLDLLVLDTDFADIDIPAMLGQLHQIAPDFKLILILAENTPAEGWDALGAQAVLPQPFYLPDLAAVIETIYGSTQSPATAHIEAAAQPKLDLDTMHAAPAWLADTKLSAQHLAQLSLESASQAALITRGAEVWAYAGELPRAAAEELAAAVSSGGEAGDLARFVHLEATQADYMLYATALSSDYKLALVFDTQVPFSKMRSQVDKMAAAMAAANGTSLAEPAVLHTQASRGEKTGATGAGLPPAVSQPLPESPQAQPPRVRWLPASQAASAGETLLSYAYVLAPRLPEHRLEGDLAEKLAAWLPQLCVAFAWRLEHLSIQPGFLQWMVSLPTETAPESVVHTLETHLSQRIFDDFQRLKRDNPSGQFFAPGFLVMNGGLPGDVQVAEFLKYMRNRQGIPNQ